MMNKWQVNIPMLFLSAICIVIMNVSADNLKNKEECSLKVIPTDESFSSVYELKFKFLGVDQDHIWFLVPEIPVGVSAEAIDDPEDPELMNYPVEVLKRNEDADFTIYRITDVVPIHAWSTVWKNENTKHPSEVVIPPGWYRIRFTYSLNGDNDCHICRCWSVPFELENESRVYLPKE